MSYDVVITGIEQLLAPSTAATQSTTYLCWGGSDSAEIPGPKFRWGAGLGRGIETTHKAGNYDELLGELSNSIERSGRSCVYRTVTKSSASRS